MSTQYQSSPKVQREGIAHLGRIIDKIQFRHAGQIQDYNYLTVGFDRDLLDFLELDASAFEQPVGDERTDCPATFLMSRPRMVSRLLTCSFPDTVGSVSCRTTRSSASFPTSINSSRTCPAR